MADYTNRDDYEAAMENWQREQQFNREQQGSIERIREKAKYDAENWEKSYTKEDTTRMMRIDK